MLKLHSFRFRIAFGEPWSRQCGDVYVLEGASSLPTSSRPTAQPCARVENICPRVQEYTNQTACVGFQLDIHSSEKTARICQPTEEDLIVPTTDSVDLRTILSPNLGNQISSKRLSRNDRMSLAKIMVSSVRQLHTTDWLMETWSEKDIVFIRDPSRFEFDARKPYLAHRFDSSLSTQR